MLQILIIDDDKNIRRYLKTILLAAGYTPICTETADEALHIMETYNIALIILDIMLPGTDGFTFTKLLRDCKNDIPILMHTAKQLPDDIKTGFLAGADDYMTKPFSPNELVARVKAHISRYDTLTSKSGDVITVGKLMIDKDAHKVTVDGKEISLTAKEYDLLLFLAENPNHSFSKEVLFDRIWGMDAIGDVSTVTVHIQRVRDKINTENERYIETIWGVGYRFNI